MVVIRTLYKSFLYSVLFFMALGCEERKKYHQDKPRREVGTSKIMADILRFQEELNEGFKNPATSPLPDRYRKDFEQLDFFPPDTAYAVKAKLERTPDALPFLMPTTTDRQSEEVLYGIVSFQLQGQNHRLEIYRTLGEGDGNTLFLPFYDSTNGSETYGGGRYIDLEMPKGDFVQIDFNQAYNPYCAYNKKYSCPIVPKINTLNIPIRAGVKAFKK